MKVSVELTRKPPPGRMPPGLMPFLGTRATAIVKTRVRAMQDLRGGSFAPLSASYAAAKQGTGRNAVPDLTLTGKMIGSIGYDQVEDLGAAKSVRVGLYGSRPSAYPVRLRRPRSKISKATGIRWTQGYRLKQGRMTSNAEIAAGLEGRGSGRGGGRRFMGLSAGERRQMGQEIVRFVRDRGGLLGR